MAAAKKHRTKVRNKDSLFFCFFGGCFGISNRVSADHAADPKPLKNARPTSGRHRRPLPPPPETVSSTTEIGVGEDHEEKRDKILPPSADDLMINKDIINCSIKGLEKEDITIPGSERWAKYSSKLSHSVSLPLLCRGKEKEKEKWGTTEKGKKGKERKIIRRELDPMVGAVIIMVTLIVMVIWGKVCAILCTASWFYFIPRLRVNLDEYYAIQPQNGTHDQNHILDLDSKEYKKMVVLQGLLDR